MNMWHYNTGRNHSAPDWVLLVLLTYRGSSLVSQQRGPGFDLRLGPGLHVCTLFSLSLCGFSIGCSCFPTPVSLLYNLLVLYIQSMDCASVSLRGFVSSIWTKLMFQTINWGSRQLLPWEWQAQVRLPQLFPGIKTGVWDCGLSDTVCIV